MYDAKVPSGQFSLAGGVADAQRCRCIDDRYTHGRNSTGRAIDSLRKETKRLETPK
ncbi:hypothetical protein [Hydrogenimonas urashimensis]|uniref:hypothetical protein n=1 Tax=Hydrogenimonas urashimensis TaxID=2740515 RepID=UPI001915A661|nr:hypothetical protein [Hydrogenimonas urashimensis]